MNDLRFAWRVLRRSPLFLVTAVVSLALGIGAATTVFSAFRAVFLRPLPFVDPSRLVEITRSTPGQVGSGALTEADLDYFRAHSRSFEGFGSYGFYRSMTLFGAGEPTNLVARVVENGFFPTLGTRPILGRTLSPLDFQNGNSRGVVLSFVAWREQFQGDPQVIGREVILDSDRYVVRGVMPQEFIFPTSFTTLWIADREPVRSAIQEYRNVIARLRPGVEEREALAELERMRPALAASYPAADREFRFGIDGLNDRDARQYRSAFLMLCGAVGLLVMIACLNVANLVIARSVAREGEFAVRSALGANRARLMRQVMVESLMLAGLSGALGLLLAWIGNRALLAALPPSYQIPRLGETRVDVAVLGFAVLVTTLTAVVFGTGPAWLLSRFNLREMGRTTTQNLRRVHWRKALVAAEVALSITLLIAAGLLIRSFLALTRVDPGFRPDHVLTVMIPASAQISKDKPVLVRRLGEIVRLSEQIPGVASAGLASAIPMGKVNVSIDFALPAHPHRSIYVTYRAVSPDYFRAIGTPLRLGRLFTRRDDAASPMVAVVNGAFARKYLPGKDPIGQKLAGAADLTIVGVVQDTHSHRLGGPAEPELFRPYQQYLGPAIGAMLVLRTKENPLGIVRALRQTIHQRFPDQPVTDVETMETRVANSTAEPKLYTALLGIFAGIALLLTAIGIYGVISYSVSQRTRELGIRMALGAAHGDVLRYVMGGGAILIVTGAGAGIAGAFLLSRYLKNQLFGVTVHDPVAFFGAPALLVGIALAACYLPARRATAIDPLTALRHD